MALRTFDDRDPAVQYVGVWRTSGNPQEEYNGTTTLTNVPGSTARVTFTGTGIDVFGTVAISEAGPVSTYAIEDNPSTEAEFVGAPTDRTQYRINFYSIKDLELGRHVLIIRNEQSSAELFLDYFTVLGPSEESLPPISSSTGSPSISPTASSTASSSSSPVAASNSPPIGPIIGGVLGGVALICLLALGIAFYRRRKNREQHAGHGHEANQVTGPPPITPYVVDRPPIPPHALSFSSQTGSGSMTTSSQPPTFTRLTHEKQPSGSHSLVPSSSVPMSSSSNLTSYPSGTAAKEVDPPPRYEG